MIAYASHTCSRKNLAALRAAGWRLLMTPWTHGNATFGFEYALDNGAWSCHQQKVEFDSAAFEKMVKRFGSGADWIAAPDIVEGGIASLEMSKDWLPFLRGTGARILIPVQDGMELDHLAPFVSPEVGLFVGGSTHFKEHTLGSWARLCNRAGAWCHVGRVNTVRRIRIFAAGGVHSIDGSSASRFSVTVPRLDCARRIGDLFASHT